MNSMTITTNNAYDIACYIEKAIGDARMKQKKLALIDMTKSLLVLVGWTQNRSEEYDKATGKLVGFCMGGAFAKSLQAFGIDDNSDEIHSAFYSSVLGSDYVVYNDNPSRTLDEVLDYLDNRRAIVEAQ